MHISRAAKVFFSNVFKDSTLINNWVSQTKTTIILQDYNSVVISVIFKLLLKQYLFLKKSLKIKCYVHLIHYKKGWNTSYLALLTAFWRGTHNPLSCISPKAAHGEICYWYYNEVFVMQTFFLFRQKKNASCQTISTLTLLTDNHIYLHVPLAS